MAGSKQLATQSFVVPVTSGQYAPERLNLGVSPSTLSKAVELIGVSALLVTNPGSVTVELWLPKIGATRDADGAIADADYTYSGNALTSGVATWPLAHWPGAQIRVKSGGTAGTAVVHASGD